MNIFTIKLPQTKLSNCLDIKCRTLIVDKYNFWLCNRFRIKISRKKRKHNYKVLLCCNPKWNMTACSLYVWSNSNGWPRRMWFLVRTLVTRIKILSIGQQTATPSANLYSRRKARRKVILFIWTKHAYFQNLKKVFHQEGVHKLDKIWTNWLSYFCHLFNQHGRV